MLFSFGNLHSMPGGGDPPAGWGGGSGSRPHRRNGPAGGAAPPSSWGAADPSLQHPTTVPPTMRGRPTGDLCAWEERSRGGRVVQISNYRGKNTSWL